MQANRAPTTEAQPEEGSAKPHSRSPLLIVAAVVTGLIAVGVAIWTFADSDDTSDAQLETATELIDTWNRGLSENDPEMAASVLTEDGVFLYASGEVVAGSRSEMERAVQTRGDNLTDLTRVSEVTELGGGVYTFVQQFYGSSGELTRAVVVMELDGELASRVQWVSDFYGPDPTE